MTYSPANHIQGIKRVIGIRTHRIEDSQKKAEQAREQGLFAYTHTAAIHQESCAVDALNRILSVFERNTHSASETLVELSELMGSPFVQENLDATAMIFIEHIQFLAKQI